MTVTTISKARTSYPIFAASFASNKSGYLVVGGGGGAGSHGVKNQITLFDFSSRAAEIQPSAEIEVSKDDSVTSLDNLATRDGLILYAGINSSEADRMKGKNEHFQAFEIKFPKAKEANNTSRDEGKIVFLSKTMLFTPLKSTTAAKDAYQRLIRLSPPQRTSSGKLKRRIGAIASSLAGDENEIVIFSATSNKPQAEDIIHRISLSQGQEVNDLDIFEQQNGKFQVAYVLSHEVHLQIISYDFDKKVSLQNNERRKLYITPSQNLGEKEIHSELRCVRWLSPRHLLLLVNKPNRTGVELSVLHVYEEGPASVVTRKTLKRSIKKATDMDVALLDSDSEGAYQIAIAVGAIDVSLNVFTVDYHGDFKNSVSNIHDFNTYHNVHDNQMTKVVFSSFQRPQVPAGRVVVSQYLRLASTSLVNTISVESFQLRRTGARHVLQTAKSRKISTGATYLVIAMIGLMAALMVQSLIDPTGSLTRGVIPQALQKSAGHHKTFGEALRDKRHGTMRSDKDRPVFRATHRIADLLHLHLPHILLGSDTPETGKALVIHDLEQDGSLRTEIHDDDETVLRQHAEAKKWDDLSKEDQKLWSKKLRDAGMWSVGEGETILKSIFFGQIGGLVGQVAQGVLS